MWRSVLRPSSGEIANSQHADGDRNRAAGMSRRARVLMGAALVLAHDTSVAIKHHPREHPWRKLS